ncbi:MAG: hypothetical protein KC502_10190 [Myxococcales bacterium]|nr:hypothetical protein [Myxococcales bacterium]
MRVLLVGAGSVEADHRLARQMRDRGDEVVLVTQGETAALLVAAEQEAVDHIVCPASQLDALTAAAKAAGLPATVQAAPELAGTGELG